MITSKVFNDEQIQFILDNYKGTGNKELYEKFSQKWPGFTFNQIKGFKHRNKLNSGLTGLWEKGQEPFNKGMKQEEYMTPEAIEKTKSTRFKKGQDPINKKPIGHERLSKDGYLYVKVRHDESDSTNNYELKHRVVWERRHGQVPEGQVIVFMDGDRTNCDVENLRLVARADMAKINKHWKLTDSPELNESIILVNEIETKIKDRSRKNETPVKSD